MPTISVLIKPASGMCNMQCDYCFYCDEMKKRSQDSYGFMSEQTLKNVIRKTMIHAEAMYIKVVSLLCVDLLFLKKLWNTRGIITSMEYG